MRVMTGRKAPVSMIFNGPMRDPSLSLAAKGLLAQLQILTEHGDKVSTQLLLDTNKAGRTALNTAIRELEEAGLLYRVRTRDDWGMLGPYAWTVMPEAQATDAS